MEIDITSFATGEDPSEYSASRAELGERAGEITWDNAKRQADHKPMLSTEEELDAMRRVLKDCICDEAEIAAFTDGDLNAWFIQLVSGDMREAGMDEVDLENFDWAEYQVQAESGQIGGNLRQADDGRIFYYLGS